jgi:GT2 family glycosyltransferase
MQNPKVLISVLNWVRYQDTIDCLHQLEKLQYDNYTVIVTDNASGNGSAEIIGRAFPSLRIIRLTGNNGFAAGHSAAAAIALRQQADFLWILNPDAKPRSDSLSRLVAAYQSHGPALFGSITLKSETPDIINFGGGVEIKETPAETPFSYNICHGRLLDECRDELRERKVQSVEGSSMLIPVDVIRLHGFMDTGYFLYGEETDYCLRMWKKGIPSVIVPASIVLHKGAASFEKSGETNPAELYYRTRNWRLIAAKHLGLARRQMLREKGGWTAFVKFYMRWAFSGRKYHMKHRMLYYENLAVLHALLHIRGKRVSPERYIPNSEKYSREAGGQKWD